MTIDSLCLHSVEILRLTVCVCVHCEWKQLKNVASNVAQKGWKVAGFDGSLLEDKLSVSYQYFVFQFLSININYFCRLFVYTEDISGVGDIHLPLTKYCRLHDPNGCNVGILTRAIRKFASNEMNNAAQNNSRCEWILWHMRRIYSQISKFSGGQITFCGKRSAKPREMETHKVVLLFGWHSSFFF